MYALKDAKLMGKTKGAIELEMTLVYNPVILYSIVIDHLEKSFKEYLFNSKD